MVQSLFTVTAAEITRNFGMWQDRANQAPIVVTHHGRSRCILLSTATYEKIMQVAPPPVAEASDHLVMDVLIERMDLAFLIVDNALVIQEANMSAAVLLGVRRHALRGQSLGAASPDLGEGLLATRLKRALQTGEQDRLHHVIKGQGADIHIFPSSGGMAITIRPNKEHGAFDQSHLENAAFHRLLAMDDRVGLVRLSVRGTIMETDPGFSRLSGIRAERLSGARLVDLLTRQDRAVIGDAIEHVFGSIGAAHRRCSLITNDGTEIPVDICITALQEEFGVGSAMVLVRDLRTN